MDTMNARGAVYDAAYNAHPGPTMRTGDTAASSARMRTSQVHAVADRSSIRHFPRRAPSAATPATSVGSTYYYETASMDDEYGLERASAGQLQLPTLATTTRPSTSAAYYATTNAHDYARRSSHAGLSGQRLLGASSSTLEDQQSATARLLMEHRARTAAILRQEEAAAAAAAYHYDHHRYDRPAAGGTTTTPGAAGAASRGLGYGGATAMAAAAAAGGFASSSSPAERTEAEIAHLQAVLDAKRAEQRLRAAAAAHAAALGAGGGGGGEAIATVSSRRDHRHCSSLSDDVDVFSSSAVQMQQQQRATTREMPSSSQQHGSLAEVRREAAATRERATSAGVEMAIMGPPGMIPSARPPRSDDGADVLAAAEACLNLAGSCNPKRAPAATADVKNPSEKIGQSVPPKTGPPPSADTGMPLPPKTKFPSNIGTSRAQSSSKTANSNNKRASPKNSEDPNTVQRRSTCGLPLKKRKSLPPCEEESTSKQPKKKGRKKENGMPRRPLSAYNIFFSEERERILNEIPGEGGEDDNGGNSSRVLSPTVTPPPQEEEDLAATHRVLMERRLSDAAGAKKRRRHRRTHGKISFRELAKTIGQRWKSLPDGRMDRYKRLAQIDMKRYQDDMERYHAALRGEIEMPFGGAASKAALPAPAS